MNRKMTLVAALLLAMTPVLAFGQDATPSAPADPADEAVADASATKDASKTDTTTISITVTADSLETIEATMDSILKSGTKTTTSLDPTDETVELSWTVGETTFTLRRGVDDKLSLEGRHPNSSHTVALPEGAVIDLATYTVTLPGKTLQWNGKQFADTATDGITTAATLAPTATAMIEETKSFEQLLQEEQAKLLAATAEPETAEQALERIHAWLEANPDKQPTREQATELHEALGQLAIETRDRHGEVDAEIAGLGPSALRDNLLSLRENLADLKEELRLLQDRIAGVDYKPDNGPLRQQVGVIQIYLEKRDLIATAVDTERAFAPSKPALADRLQALP